MSQNQAADWGEIGGTKRQCVTAVRGRGSVAWDGPSPPRRRPRSRGRWRWHVVPVKEAPPPPGGVSPGDEGTPGGGEFRAAPSPVLGDPCLGWATAIGPAQAGRGPRGCPRPDRVSVTEAAAGDARKTELSGSDSSSRAPAELDAERPPRTTPLPRQNSPGGRAGFVGGPVRVERRSNRFPETVACPA